MTSQSILILHFNDAYTLDVVAKFATSLKQYKHENPLITFGGDLFNPSLLSTVSRGKHMCSILDALEVHYSTIGNHDLDFGIERLEKLISNTKCKWVLSNLRSSHTKQPFQGMISHDLIEWNGMRVGIIGLVEENWTKHLGKVAPSDMLCDDFVTVGRDLARTLKRDGAELVIALTHMHYVNDEALAKEVHEIDVILGGHDHQYDCRMINNTPIVKSGSDFLDVTALKVTITDGQKSTSMERVRSSDFPDDEDMKNLVFQLSHEVEAKLTKEVFECTVDLDTRYDHIRKEESAIGNLIADVLAITFRTDIAFLNAGSIRSNCLFKAGKHTMKDIIAMFPFDDIGTTMTVSGRELLWGIEMALRKLPIQDGRFPVLAGLNITINSANEPMHRVLHVLVNGEQLDLDREYLIATNQFTASKDFERHVDAEDGQLLSTILANYFHDQVEKHEKEKVLVAIGPRVEGRIVDKPS